MKGNCVKGLSVLIARVPIAGMAISRSLLALEAAVSG
jgi:hypothetical protein